MPYNPQSQAAYEALKSLIGTFDVMVNDTSAVAYAAKRANMSEEQFLKLVRHEFDVVTRFLLEAES